MFIGPKLQATIRKAIDRRLDKGGNDCQITIKRMTRQIIKKLGYTNTLGMRKRMNIAIFRVLEQYNIELWGYTSRNYQIRDKENMPLSTHIYRVRR